MYFKETFNLSIFKRRTKPVIVENLKLQHLKFMLLKGNLFEVNAAFYQIRSVDPINPEFQF